MDLSFTPEEIAFRDEMRRFFREEFPADIREKVAAGHHLTKEETIRSQRVLNERGLAVPGDVALAGFDDIPMASFVNPALTTVRQDTGKAGEVLVDELLRLIRGEGGESAMLPAELKVRRSSLRVG